MTSIRKCLLAAFALFFFPHPTRAEDRVVAYVPSWVGLAKFSETIDYSKITHLNIAFENPANAGGDLSFHRESAALIANAHRHHVAVFVSIGGGGASTNEAMRQRYETLMGEFRVAGFVAKLAAYLTAHDFDGLDVDLEGEAIGPNYSALITALAPALKANGKQLTAALSRYSGSKVPDSALPHFDFVNVMAYDATGPWSPKKPGQHSSMAYAQNGVRYWLDRGLPKSKVVLGLPFYGYSFGNDSQVDSYSYRQIIDKFPGAENGDQAGGTIWYNGRATIKAKTTWARQQGLGGIMIWSLDGDGKDGHSLLTAIDEARHGK